MRRCYFENDQSRHEVLNDLASLYHKQRNFRKARLLFESYVREGGGAARRKEVLSLLGLTCTAMGDIDEGVRWYRQALEIDAGFKEAWLNLFQAYKESGKARLRAGACICDSLPVSQAGARGTPCRRRCRRA